MARKSGARPDAPVINAMERIAYATLKLAKAKREAKEQAEQDQSEGGPHG